MSRGLLVFMAVVTHLGISVLAAGIVFYVTGRDPIAESDAGTTLGPAMVLASMAVVFVVLARRFGVEAREREQRGVEGRRARILGSALLALALAYVAMLVTGGFLYAFRRGELIWIVLFAGRYAVSAFVIVTAVSAAVTVALARLVAAASSDD